MAMTLTKDDLKAVGSLIRDAVEASESRLVARIDDLDDVLSRQMEHGLQEVRDRLGAVERIVDRIDQVQQAELERNDRQDQAIHRIRKSLHAA